MNRWRIGRKERQEMRNTADGMTVGIMFGVSIAMAAAAGAWVDRKLGTEPWGVVIGVLMGAAAGFVNLFQVVLRISREDEEARRKKKD